MKERTVYSMFKRFLIFIILIYSVQTIADDFIDIRNATTVSLQKVLDLSKTDTAIGKKILVAYPQELEMFKQILEQVNVVPISATVNDPHCSNESSSLVAAYYDDSRHETGIHICPTFLSSSTLGKVTTLIHEISHYLGERSEQNAAFLEMFVTLVEKTKIPLSSYLLNHRNDDLRKKFVLLSELVNSKKAIPFSSEAAYVDFEIQISREIVEKIVSDPLLELEITPNYGFDPTNQILSCTLTRTDPNPNMTRAFSLIQWQPDKYTYPIKNVDTQYIKPFDRFSMTDSRALSITIDGPRYGVLISCRMIIPGHMTIEDVQGILANPMFSEK